MIELGNKVRDSITGFTGIATGKTTWLYGCERICVQPQALHNGKPIDAEWFDDQQVELVEESKPMVSESSVAAAGGPQRDPKR